MNAAGPVVADPADCTDAVCVTCSDEGRPGRVIGPDGEEPGLILVESDRGRESVDVSLVGGAEAGDQVLIHAGLAIAKTVDGDWGPA